MLFATLRFPENPELFARATPKVSFSISSIVAPPKWCGSERAAEPADGG